MPVVKRTTPGRVSVKTRIVRAKVTPRIATGRNAVVRNARVKKAAVKRSTNSQVAIKKPGTTTRGVSRKKAPMRLNFQSVRSVETGLQKLRLSPQQLGATFRERIKASKGEAAILAKAVLAGKGKLEKDVEAERLALVRAANAGGSSHRRVLCKAFKESKQNLYLVHAMSQLTKAEARNFMKDYLAEGGDLESVAEWLQIAGSELKRRRPKGRPKDGLIGAIKKGAKSVGKGVKKGAKTVGKGVKKGAKAVGKGAKTTATKTGGAVKKSAKTVGRGVKKGAKTVGRGTKTVVRKTGSAVKKGAKGVGRGAKVVGKAAKTVVKKTGKAVKTSAQAVGKGAKQVVKGASKAATFVAKSVKAGVQLAAEGVMAVTEALIAAGKSISHLLVKVANWTVQALGDVVSALLDAGRKVGEIILSAANAANLVAGKFLRALRAAGVPLTNVLAKVVDVGTKAIRYALKGLRELGQRAANVLNQVVGRAARIIRVTLEGMLAVGFRLVDSVVAIVRDINVQFRKGFFQGLLAVVKSPLKVMKAAVEAGGSIVALALSVLLETLTFQRRLSAEEMRHARLIYGTSIDLNQVRVASSFPTDVAFLLNGQRPFTTMYILNFPSWKQANLQTVIHELAHVWQSVQVGPVYMLQALHAQIKKGKAAYSYSDDQLRRFNGNFGKFNREQQAAIVEEYWALKFGPLAPGRTRNEARMALLAPYALQVKGPRRKVPVLKLVRRVSPVRVRRLAKAS